MSVGRSALKSTLFVAANSYFNMGVNFVTGVTLARILLPEHFGVVALASFFLGLFGRVREFGLDLALVHKQEDLDKTLSTHFFLQILLALVNFILILVALPLLSRYYSSETILVLLIIGSFVVLKAASATQRVYLEKELLFKYTSVFDMASLLISSIISVVAAVKGFGLWSLVLGNTSYTFFNFLFLWILRPWKLRFDFDKKIAIWFFKFGSFLWIGGITTFIILQYNDFLVGTFLGITILGYYSRAFNYSQIPTNLVTSVVSRVAFPTYAKLQSDKIKLQTTFSLVLRNIVRFSAPISLILVLTAADFIEFLIGPKWLPMVPIFQILIVYSLLRPIFDDTGSFLAAIGKPNLVAKYLTAMSIIFLIISPLLMNTFGVAGSAISLGIILLLGVFLAYYYASKFIKIDFPKIFGPVILATLLSAIVYFLIKAWYNFASLPIFYRLAVEWLILGVSYLILIFIFEKKQIKEDLKLLLSIIKK